MALSTLCGLTASRVPHAGASVCFCHVACKQKGSALRCTTGRENAPPAGLASLGALCILSVLLALPYQPVLAHVAAMTGTPSPPAVVGLNFPYQVTTAGVPDPGWRVVAVHLFGAPGDASGPTGGWRHKQMHVFVPEFACNAPAGRTWNGVHQASGYYWWRAVADFRNCATGAYEVGIVSGPFGYYRTF
ncbi:MAG: hypothetical protein RMJ43_10655 [Chloroherpetonaceae bacterium]|nr:hypothetical protein [Chthonomonadaceae bacterium]MDW8208290.1 hypothetical protein [Chloroherpetonaceae bacterium]